MEKYNEEMYSCNFFFNICLISHSKDETLKQISERISIYMKKKFDELVREGLCCCSICKPANFKNNAIWMLKETNHEFRYIKKYIVCKNFISKTLKKIFIGEYEQLKMNLRCEKKKHFLKSLGSHPCCYGYYRSGLLAPEAFCVNCKVFLSSLTDFNLRRVHLIT